MKKAFRLSCVMQDYRANRHLNCRYLALRNKELTQHIPGRPCGLESYFLGKNARPCGLESYFLGKTARPCGFESYFTSFFLTAFRQFAHSKSPLRKDRDGCSAIRFSNATRRCTYMRRRCFLNGSRQ